MAAYAALVSIMHIVDNLELHPRPPISLDKKQVHLLTEKVTFLQEFLEGYNPNLGYSTEADPLESRIADAAYEAEDAIESHIVDQITSNGEKISSDALYQALEKVIEEMALIETEAIETKQTVGVQHQLHTKSTPPDSSRSPSIAQKSSMVGADDVLFDLKDKLTSHCRDLQIIPIVGMGGTGKTTLATNIYQDLLIKEHFHICAWAKISLEYSIIEIFTEILRQLNERVDKLSSEDELGGKLYRYLYGRKYLIIMDDMWSNDVWDRVRRYFPDNKNGSRIVVTTRLSNLASELSYSGSVGMELLDEANSWDLLSKTVFGEERCPLELVEIGKKIGKSCKGLPLSIVVVGGFLAKSKHAREFWEYIQENLNSMVINLEDDQRCLKILHMSYKQLPVYLKPCFLYMGVFPEDEVIHISRLAKLWVAEGFLKPVNGKSLEEIARVYLKDLIDRNLVIIHKMRSTGKMKQCKIHDLLRELCLREAQKERFYSTVFARPPTPQGVVNSQRRIVISKNEAIDALSSMSLARSLIWNVERQTLPPLSLRLLRILESRRFQSKVAAEFLENMHNLVNSRFLAFSSEADYKFPFPIRLFWNLQTLIVGIYGGIKDVTAPTDIWYMPHIRHVQFLQLHLPDPPPNSQDDIVLGNLQTLGKVWNFKCSKQMVKRIPNIKKLQIKYDDEEFYYGRYCLNNLGCLDKLETLSCKFFQGYLGSLHRLINFPHSLNKLTLQIPTSQCWEDILDKIGVLPLLQKLVLEFGSFKEGRWETTQGHFGNLKFLAVSHCKGLQVWKTESSHFPCLDHLLLQYIYELNEIPLDFAEVSTLRVIDVKYSSDSAVASAERILKEHEELYDEGALQVQVWLQVRDEALESLARPNFRVIS